MGIVTREWGVSAKDTTEFYKVAQAWPGLSLNGKLVPGCRT